MAVDKNFIVRNGLEVGGTLIWAQAGSGKVGINTTQFEGANIFQVAGGIGATSLTVAQNSTFYNTEITNALILDDAVISIAGTVGKVNQYVRSTGSGLAWADLPISQKFSSNFTASPGQVTFAATYVIGLVDVFINGVRLTESEYVAVDGATISLLNPCFGGENIDIVGQATIGLGSTDAIQGITILEEGVAVGAAANITSINFVGAAVTAVGLGVGVTVYIDPPLGGGDSYWNPIGTTGIHTSRSVAIGTQSLSGSEILRVQGDARVTGILTVGESSITFNGQNNTIGIGTGTVINETGITVGIISATTITGSLSGAASSVTVTNSVSTTTTYYPTFTSNNGEILVDQSKLLYQPSTGELKAGSVNISGLTSTRTLSVFSGVSGGLTITGITTINSGRLQFGTGLENVRIGYNAAPNVTGNSNIAIGDQPLVGVTTGSTNIAIGQYALDTLTGGSRNIAIGERAGRFLTGNNNVIIGKFDGNSNNLDIRTSSNNIVIADGQGNIRQYITSTGKVGFNTFNPVTDFHVIGNSIFAGIVTATAFVGDGSGLTNIIGSTSYWTTSGIGIHTLSNVGVGTTNPTSALTVRGNTSLETLNVSGISTFQNDLKVAEYSYGTNSNQITLGNNKFRIYSDGSNTYLKNYDTNTEGDLYIETDELLVRKYDGTETIAQFTEGAGVKLNYQGIKKFETLGAGATVTGTTFTNQLSVSGVSTFQSNVYLGDSDVLNFGNSNNLQISYNPGVTPYNFINGGTTALTIRSGDLDIQSGSQNYTSFSANNTETSICWVGTNSNSQRVKVNQTSVELYADVKVLPVDSFPARFSVGTGGTVITTTSDGLVGIGITNPTSNLHVNGNGRFTGVVTATSFVGDGSQLTGISGSGGTLGVGTFYASIGVTTTIHTLSNSNVVSEYTLFFQYNSTIQSQKVMVMNNGSTAYAQEYAIMYEPSQIVSVGATVSGSNVLLQVTPKSGITGITTFKYLLQVVS
jgi:hypothetical protein